MAGPPCPPPPSCPPPPPGTPIPNTFTPTITGAAPGSMWVFGSNLYYIAANGTACRGTGVAGATVLTARRGSIWVEGDDFKYIDDSRITRTLQKTSLGAEPTAVVGSCWVESPSPAGQQMTWVGTSLKEKWWNGL